MWKTVSEAELEEQTQSGDYLEKQQTQADLDPVDQPGEPSDGTEHHQQLQHPTIHGQRRQDVLPNGHHMLRWQKIQFSRLFQPVLIHPRPAMYTDRSTMVGINRLTRS